MASRTSSTLEERTLLAAIGIYSLFILLSFVGVSFDCVNYLGPFAALVRIT